MKDLEGIPDRTKAPKRPKAARGEAWGILNPYGDLWTYDTFQSAPEAFAYVKRFWTNSAGMAPAGVRLGDFKPVRVKVTVSVARERKRHSSPLLTAEEGPGCKPPTSS